MRSQWSRLLDSTFNWVCEHRNQFHINDVSDRTRQVDLLKPIGELALACGILWRVPSAVPNSTLRQLLDWCWSELSDGELLAEVIRYNPELIVLTSIYATFHEIGFRCSSVENEIRFAISTKGVRALEFPAWRRLDLLTALSRIGMEHGEDIKSVVGRTWLGARPEPWMLSDGAAYSVTHTIFYVTDFGRSPRALPEQYSEYLGRWVPAWLTHYGRVDNLDLFSEFLMVRRCLGQANPERWCDLLLGRQASDGAIPGPQHGGQLLMIGETDNRQRAFFQDYHTTLVTLMAAAMSIPRPI